MRYFREMKVWVTTSFNFVLGLVSGWFVFQAGRLLLAFSHPHSIFWRVIGLQYLSLIFLIVYSLNQKLWKKHRHKAAPATKEQLIHERPILIARLCAVVASYLVGAGLVCVLMTYLK